MDPVAVERLLALCSQEQRELWAAHVAGSWVRFRDLPKNGRTCLAVTMGGPYCGFPLLIDGSCINRSSHLDVVEEEL